MSKSYRSLYVAKAVRRGPKGCFEVKPMRRCEEQEDRVGEALAVRLGGARRGGLAEEVRSSEEGLPQLKEQSLERSARSYKATTGVGCDACHP